MNKKIILVLISFFSWVHSFTQVTQTVEDNLLLQNNIETSLQNFDVNNENDYNIKEESDYFIQHPININSADEQTLDHLNLLSPVQLQAFFGYRNTLGPFIDILEIQSIPYWDIALIQQILPFLTCNISSVSIQTILGGFKGGHHSFMLRSSQIIPLSKGYQNNTASDENRFLGIPQRISFKYQYNKNKQIQCTFLADKDPGENFFNYSGSTGFDFYSLNINFQRLGHLQSLILGDYTLNLGQGLIQWQQIAFKKSANFISMKRSSSVIKPYTSFNEYNFQRGLAVTMKYKKYQFSIFASHKKNDGNIDVDSINSQKYVTSFITDGLHQTTTELQKKDNLIIQEWGGAIQRKHTNGEVSFNFLQKKFDIPVKKTETPYNLYAFSGNYLLNASLSYAFTKRNVHFFGETACSDNMAFASVNGAFVSVSKKVELGLLYRNISVKYWSMNANAFTESSTPKNEQGFFTGLQFKLNNSVQLNAYVDLFCFPWLKYQINMPSIGNECLLQLYCKPSKNLEYLFRYKSNNQQDNIIQYEDPIYKVGNNFTESVKTQILLKINNSLTYTGRIEFRKIVHEDFSREEGFLMGASLSYKLPVYRTASTLGLAFFETNSYNSRVYFTENDYSSITSIGLYDKGIRCYVAFHTNLKKNIKLFLKIAQTCYRGKSYIGEGVNQIIGNKITDIKTQISYSF